MAWIETHQALLTHRKTGRLMRALNISRPTALGHLTALWLWCIDNAPDGDLTGIDPEDVAEGAYWEGDAGAFLAGLIQAGWVDDTAHGPHLHDWDDYAGRLIEQRRANADRMRAKRAAHVQRTTSARTGATVHNSTVHNNTPLPPVDEPPTPDEAPPEDVPPVKTRKATAMPAPKAGTGFDYPVLWRLIEQRMGYKPTWNYTHETQAVKRLLATYPTASADDLARFLSYVGTVWPFCNEPDRQPTFSEGSTHFGKWYAGGQPPVAAGAKVAHSLNGHSAPRASPVPIPIDDGAARRRAQRAQTQPPNAAQEATEI